MGKGYGWNIGLEDSLHWLDYMIHSFKLCKIYSEVQASLARINYVTFIIIFHVYHVKSNLNQKVCPEIGMMKVNIHSLIIMMWCRLIGLIVINIHHDHAMCCQCPEGMWTS